MQHSNLYKFRDRFFFSNALRSANAYNDATDSISVLLMIFMIAIKFTNNATRRDNGINAQANVYDLNLM